ncbi:hypothetical protein [Bizionia arctica]|nr:hypothetical protein [Bizionia arctica]
MVKLFQNIFTTIRDQYHNPVTVKNPIVPEVSKKTSEYKHHFIMYLI